MDDDRVKGSAKQITGAVKEAIGKLTGDAKTEAKWEGGQDRRKGPKRCRRCKGCRAGGIKAEDAVVSVNRDRVQLR